MHAVLVASLWYLCLGSCCVQAAYFALLTEPSPAGHCCIALHSWCFGKVKINVKLWLLGIMKEEAGNYPWEASKFLAVEVAVNFG